MDGLWWKPLIKMDDLGVPLFLETPIYVNKKKYTQIITNIGHCSSTPTQN